MYGMLTGTLSSGVLLLHEIDAFDFGYLPYPKYDENQKDYIVWSAGGLLAIPNTASDISRTGAVVEALSAASTKYIKDAFVEKYIEGKVLRDEESVEIYRMMRDLATYDISYNRQLNQRTTPWKISTAFSPHFSRPSLRTAASTTVRWRG